MGSGWENLKVQLALKRLMKNIIIVSFNWFLTALVMGLYSNARSRVRTLADTSAEFGIEVGVHIKDLH